MDAALAFLLKLLGTTARIGAVIALTAFALCLLAQAQIQPFAQLAGTTLYQTIIVAGVVGASTLIVEIFISLYRLINERLKQKVIFIEQPGGFWDYVETDGVLQLQALLHLTNKNSRHLIISRPQLCLPSFARPRVWQQSFQLQVGDDFYLGTDAPSLRPKTLSIVVVKHIAVVPIAWRRHVAKPRSRNLVFLFEFRDQWKRRHRTRLHLQRLSQHGVSFVPPGRLRPGPPASTPRQLLDISPRDAKAC
jgi:hypothetical protein